MDQYNFSDADSNGTDAVTESSAFTAGAGHSSALPNENVGNTPDNSVSVDTKAHIHGKTIRSQTRAVIYNVALHFKEEQEE